LAAFVVGYSAVAYFLVTLPQRSTFNSIANLPTTSEVKKEAVKAETPADTTSASNNGATAITPVAQPAANTGSVPVVSSETTPATEPTTTTPTTPVVTVPEVPTVPVPDPVDPTIPIVDPIIDLVDGLL